MRWTNGGATDTNTPPSHTAFHILVLFCLLLPISQSYKHLPITTQPYPPPHNPTHHHTSNTQQTTHQTTQHAAAIAVTHLRIDTGQVILHCRMAARHPVSAPALCHTVHRSNGNVCENTAATTNGRKPQCLPSANGSIHTINRFLVGQTVPFSQSWFGYYTQQQ